MVIDIHSYLNEFSVYFIYFWIVGYQTDFLEQEHVFGKMVFQSSLNGFARNREIWFPLISRRFSFYFFPKLNVSLFESLILFLLFQRIYSVFLLIVLLKCFVSYYFFHYFLHGNLSTMMPFQFFQVVECLFTLLSP